MLAPPPVDFFQFEIQSKYLVGLLSNPGTLRKNYNMKRNLTKLKEIHCVLVQTKELKDSPGVKII